MRNLLNTLASISPWQFVLACIFGFHILALAYDIGDTSDVSETRYYLRALTLFVYALLCFLAWRKQWWWAVVYIALSIAGTAILFYLRDAENLMIAAQALYPLNIVFSIVLALKIVATKPKKY
ncbi:MAG: hypothetical protein RL660_1293 [Bacteroidota bacterium]|jgi:hypothetical protein